ncbi:MAG: hypothetical protein LUH05_09450, partial [Candidatus Gastranaerophilales bacterium]|nr:hypothetical protein [Candidatus Gastranaerophilales bacterium]
MKYKVVILTAGTGSRLDNLTQYINKSLVSIENKPVISRITDMFPRDTEFVIALGYKGNLVKEFLTLCYPERKFDFCTVDKYEGEGSGVGYSLLSCEKYLQEPFIFCSCDTIVTGKIPDPIKNIAGFAIRENKGQYRTLKIEGNKAAAICEKSCDDNKNAYIGLSCIFYIKIFVMKCIKKRKLKL